MRLSDKLHLCYSLNVFPGSTWLDKFDVIQRELPVIRQNVVGNDTDEFAIGLWLDHKSADYLLDKANLQQLKQFLADHGYYIFTVNAFPYGVFHQQRVKEGVYRPDWADRERMLYTCKVADILAELLPQGVTGSISTVPGTYKMWAQTDRYVADITENLLEAADYLKRLHEATGKRIQLAVEMEPDCLWESPQQFVDYYEHYLKSNSCAAYIGVCYDTCHQELLSNKPGEGIQILQKAGIDISKIQLSAGVKSRPIAECSGLDKMLHDDIYLHQTRLLASDSTERRFTDLPDALRCAEKDDRLVTHYHVPLYMEELAGGLSAANDEMKAVLESLQQQKISCSNIELETYTYQVLPEELKQKSVTASIILEYRHILNNLTEKNNGEKEV